MKINQNAHCVLIMLFCMTVGFPIGTRADSIKRADKEDVAMLLNAATGMNSAYWATLIGETRGRVYIDYTTSVHASSLFSNKPEHIVYWLPSSEITKEELDKFKGYKKKLEGDK